jgi:hypothetical protein
MRPREGPNSATTARIKPQTTESRLNKVGQKPRFGMFAAVQKHSDRRLHCFGCVPSSPPIFLGEPENEWPIQEGMDVSHDFRRAAGVISSADAD